MISRQLQAFASQIIGGTQAHNKLPIDKEIRQSTLKSMPQVLSMLMGILISYIDFWDAWEYQEYYLVTPIPTFVTQ